MGRVPVAEFCSRSECSSQKSACGASWLQMLAPVEELPWLQFRTLWIFGDVTAQKVELFDRTHQVVKAVLLPKVPLAVQQSVDLGRREMLP